MISINRRNFLSAMAMAGLGRAFIMAWPANAEEPLLSHADQLFDDHVLAVLWFVDCINLQTPEKPGGRHLDVRSDRTADVS